MRLCGPSLPNGVPADQALNSKFMLRSNAFGGLAVNEWLVCGDGFFRVNSGVMLLVKLRMISLLGDP